MPLEHAKVPVMAGVEANCSDPVDAADGDKCRGDFAKYVLESQ